MKKWLALTAIAASLASAGASAHAAPFPSADPAAQTAVSRSYVVPHFTERVGRITNTPQTFDTVFYMYVPPRGVTLDLYLLDKADGLPMKGGRPGQLPREVCNPCTLQFGAGATRRPEIIVDNLIEAAGGFTKNVYLGQAIIVVRGTAEDLDRFKIQYWLVNSHSNTSELAWSVLELQPMPGALR
jgi:hypothetical protein